MHRFAAVAAAALAAVAFVAPLHAQPKKSAEQVWNDLYAKREYMHEYLNRNAKNRSGGKPVPVVRFIGEKELKKK